MEDKNSKRDRIQKILNGLEQAYKKLVEFKRYKNSPLIVSDNKCVIKIEPNKNTTYNNL